MHLGDGSRRKKVTFFRKILNIFTKKQGTLLKKDKKIYKFLKLTVYIRENIRYNEFCNQ